MKVLIFVAALLAITTAYEIDELRSIKWSWQQEPVFVSDMDWRNGTYNVSQFMMGFSYGAYGEPLYDLSHCLNDSWDLSKTIKRDFEPLIHGGSIERAAAVSDLIWHLVRDIPDMLGNCGHISNKTRDMIEITKALFHDVANFKNITSALLHSIGPCIKFVTAAARDFEDGDWYGAGYAIGNVFKIVIEYAANHAHETYQSQLNW